MANVIPDTQREAWKAIQPKLNGRHLKVLEALGRPMAGYELANTLGWQLYRTLPRLTELKEKGLVKDSGIRRINPESNKNTIVWELV